MADKEKAVPSMKDGTWDCLYCGPRGSSNGSGCPVCGKAGPSDGSGGGVILPTKDLPPDGKKSEDGPAENIKL